MVRDWVRVLKNDGVKVFMVSPGFLATGLNNVGVEKLKQVSLKQSCRFFDNFANPLP